MPKERGNSDQTLFFVIKPNFFVIRPNSKNISILDSKNFLTIFFP